ncbi:hypothetical protein [Gemmatimonas sp.]
MPTVDNVHALLEHTVALVNGDAELRTLMGRNAGLIVPWQALTVDGPLPIIAYTPITGGTPLSSRAERYTLGFSVHAATSSVANTICARLKALLRSPAYAARGADIARDPTSAPTRAWPDADPRQDDAAIARADIDLTFLVAG